MAGEAGWPGGEPDFDDYAGSYGEAVDRAIAFAGAPHDLYTRVKANALEGLASRRLGDPGGLELLDVGCGPGETDRLLEGRFRRLAGVDVAEGMVAAASRRNPWAEYRAYAEGEPLPFPDASFDLTFTICVLHHVTPHDRSRVVSEMSRVTRPGGMVAIFEHNPWNPLTRRVVRDCEFDQGVTLLSRRRTAGLLSGAGLELVESPYILFFPRDGAGWRRAERAISRLPLGAQYYAAARRR